MPRTGAHTKHVTRDDRARIRTLYYDAGFTQPRIASITGLTINQVKRSVAAKDAEIQPRSGRPPVMLAEDVDLMIDDLRGPFQGPIRQIRYPINLTAPEKIVVFAAESIGYGNTIQQSNRASVFAAESIDTGNTIE
ncbi:hypothetical protein MY3296_006131 [Beauveria thailandica]